MKTSYSVFLNTYLLCRDLSSGFIFTACLDCRICFPESAFHSLFKTDPVFQGQCHLFKVLKIFSGLGTLHSVLQWMTNQIFTKGS